MRETARLSVRAPPTVSAELRLKATELVWAPPVVSALPWVWALPQFSPRVTPLKPPWELVSAEEWVTLLVSELKVPLVSAWEVPPPTLLDWL